MKVRTMILFVATLLVVAACGTTAGDDTTVPDDSNATTTSSGPVQEEATTTTGGVMDGAHVAETDLGEILVDADGFTLYVFDVDTDGESACYDACAGLWPAVPADTAISSDLDQAIFGSSARTDGSQQLTVNGRPLYRYTPDTAPGDVMGQGFNDVWWVVDASGNAVEAAAADEIVIDYGY